MPFKNEHDTSSIFLIMLLSMLFQCHMIFQMNLFNLCKSLIYHVEIRQHKYVEARLCCRDSFLPAIFHTARSNKKALPVGSAFLAAQVLTLFFCLPLWN